MLRPGAPGSTAADLACALRADGQAECCHFAVSVSWQVLFESSVGACIHSFSMDSRRAAGRAQRGRERSKE